MKNFDKILEAHIDGTLGSKTISEILRDCDYKVILLDDNTGIRIEDELHGRPMTFHHIVTTLEDLNEVLVTLGYPRITYKKIQCETDKLYYLTDIYIAPSDKTVLWKIQNGEKPKTAKYGFSVTDNEIIQTNGMDYDDEDYEPTDEACAKYGESCGLFKIIPMEELPINPKDCPKGLRQYIHIDNEYNRNFIEKTTKFKINPNYMQEIFSLAKASFLRKYANYNWTEEQYDQMVFNFFKTNYTKEEVEEHLDLSKCLPAIQRAYDYDPTKEIPKTISFTEYIYADFTEALSEHKNTIRTKLYESLCQGGDTLWDIINEIINKRNKNLLEKSQNVKIEDIMNFIEIHENKIYADYSECNFDDCVIGFAVPCNFLARNYIKWLENNEK